MLIIRRSKLYYTASGVITPVGGRPVHRLREDNDYTEMHGQQNMKQTSKLVCILPPDSTHLFRLTQRDEFH